MTWQFRRTWQIAAVLLAGIVPAATALSRAPPSDRRSPAPRRTARPPGGWADVTRGAFLDDAFAVLKGERPAFDSTVPPPDPRRSEARPGEPPPGAALAWSSLVGPDTLTDEIKDMTAVVTAATSTASRFKGGGFDDARDGFSMIALAFGVIAAHDENIRWKQHAGAARDLFARAGFACTAGSDRAFREARARIDDLRRLLDGESPDARPDPDRSSWSKVAARQPLMKRLQAAETAIVAGTAARADFDRDRDRLVREAEIVAMIGEVIRQPDFEYHDDETYSGHAATMRDAAVRLREACRRQDHAAARSAAADLKTSCDACHGEYRG